MQKDPYTSRYFRLITEAGNDRDQITDIINKIYEDGFTDGTENPTISPDDRLTVTLRHRQTGKTKTVTLPILAFLTGQLHPTINPNTGWEIENITIN